MRWEEIAGVKVGVEREEWVVDVRCVAGGDGEMLEDGGVSRIECVDDSAFGGGEVDLRVSGGGWGGGQMEVVLHNVAKGSALVLRTKRVRERLVCARMCCICVPQAETVPGLCSGALSSHAAAP
jgi:hypothetical protein